VPSAAALASSTNARRGLAPGQTAVRALFTGGTFCYEAQLAFVARGLRCRANARSRVPRRSTADGTAMSSSTWATTTTRAGGRTR
jgi:hypothetical protein